jgi:hypothetical protein
MERDRAGLDQDSIIRAKRKEKKAGTEWASAGNRAKIEQGMKQTYSRSKEGLQKSKSQLKQNYSGLQQTSTVERMPTRSSRRKSRMSSSRRITARGA